MKEEGKAGLRWRQASQKPRRNIGGAGDGSEEGCDEMRVHGCHLGLSGKCHRPMSEEGILSALKIFPFKERQ